MGNLQLNKLKECGKGIRLHVKCQVSAKSRHDNFRSLALTFKENLEKMRLPHTYLSAHTYFECLDSSIISFTEPHEEITITNEMKCKTSKACHHNHNTHRHLKCK